MDPNNNVQPPVEPVNTPAPATITPPATMPAQSSPVVMPPQSTQVETMNQPVNMKKPSSKRKKMLLLIGIPILLLLALVAGYFFYYLPNQPSYIWKSSLKSSSILYSKALSEYEKDKEVLGADISGAFKSTGDFVSDGTISGSFDPKGNGSMKFDAGAVGVRISGEVRSIIAEGQNTPDLYFNVAGFKGLGAGYGLPGLDKYDGQWISADHTLLDQAIASSGANSSSEQLTPDDVVALLKVIGEVNDDYLWTTDKDKSVFEVKEQLGNEKVDDRDTYHFKVGINKENMKTYVKQLGERARAVEGSEALKDFTKQTFSETSINAMVKDIEDSKDDVKPADVWVDKATKTIRRVRITDEKDDASYVDFGMRYEGGDELPFYFAGVDKSGKGEFSLSVNIKAKSASLKASFEASGTNFEGNLDLKNRTEAVQVEKPAKSIPIMQVYGELLGGAYGGSDYYGTSGSSTGSSSGSIN